MRIDTDAGPVAARAVIACAGLQSDRVARLAGTRPPVRIVPFRGDYYTLGQETQDLVRGLLYPVPDPAFPFLGVHFTKRLDGSVVAGPNAVLALARERYRRAGTGRSRRRERDRLQRARGDSPPAMSAPPRASCAATCRRARSCATCSATCPKYGPTTSTFGPTGIRAQALAPDGRLVDDFLIVGTPRVMHVLNAPSPAATASLAIGDELAERALRDVITSS